MLPLLGGNPAPVRRPKRVPDIPVGGSECASRASPQSRDDDLQAFLCGYLRCHHGSIRADPYPIGMRQIQSGMDQFALAPQRCDPVALLAMAVDLIGQGQVFSNPLRSAGALVRRSNHLR
jgi:hypothetical protein